MEEFLLRAAVDAAIAAIKAGNNDAKRAALAARNRWHDYLDMLDEKARSDAIDRWVNYLADRVEQESLSV